MIYINDFIYANYINIFNFLRLILPIYRKFLFKFFLLRLIIEKLNIKFYKFYD